MFLRYVAARAEQERRDTIYRIYVSDLLKGIAPIPRYAELAYPELFEPANDNPEEIIQNIIGKLRE